MDIKFGLIIKMARCAMFFGKGVHKAYVAINIDLKPKLHNPLKRKRHKIQGAVKPEQSKDSSTQDEQLSTPIYKKFYHYGTRFMDIISSKSFAHAASIFCIMASVVSTIIFPPASAIFIPIISAGIALACTQVIGNMSLDFLHYKMIAQKKSIRDIVHKSQEMTMGQEVSGILNASDAPFILQKKIKHSAAEKFYNSAGSIRGALIKKIGIKSDSALGALLNSAIYIFISLALSIATMNPLAIISGLFASVANSLNIYIEGCTLGSKISHLDTQCQGKTLDGAMTEYHISLANEIASRVLLKMIAEIDRQISTESTKQYNLTLEGIPSMKAGQSFADFTQSLDATQKESLKIAFEAIRNQEVEKMNGGIIEHKTPNIFKQMINVFIVCFSSNDAEKKFGADMRSEIFTELEQRTQDAYQSSHVSFAPFHQTRDEPTTEQGEHLSESLVQRRAYAPKHSKHTSHAEAAEVTPEEGTGPGHSM